MPGEDFDQNIDFMVPPFHFHVLNSREERASLALGCHTGNTGRTVEAAHLLILAEGFW